MHPALPSPVVDATSAVFAVNGEKPHQGVTGKNRGLHQRFAASNSTTALGVSSCLWSGTVPGATVSYEYDAFGNSFTVSGSTPNEMMYRGEQLDSDLGLYYLRARYYNPLTGRFMSRDPLDVQPRNPDGTPIDPKELHKYLYAGGDPVNRIDPRGQDDEEEYFVIQGETLETELELRATAAQVRMELCIEALMLEIGTTRWPMPGEEYWWYEEQCAE